MKVALAAVRDLKPAAVKTAVSFKTGTYKPDFSALEDENFIILPWDLEVIVNGEIVVRPDYREKLKEGPPVERSSRHRSEAVPRRLHRNSRRTNLELRRRLPWLATRDRDGQ